MFLMPALWESQHPPYCVVLAVPCLSDLELAALLRPKMRGPGRPTIVVTASCGVAQAVVAGFKASKKLDRFVKRGEKGIVVITPMRIKPTDVIARSIRWLSVFLPGTDRPLAQRKFVAKSLQKQVAELTDRRLGLECSLATPEPF